MSIEITDLDSLAQADVLDALERARSFISEQYPDRQIKGGPFDELVLRSDAILGTVHRENFNRLLNSQSLKAIEDDPTLVDDEVLDSLASNYRIERSEGQLASGSVMIVVSNNNDTVIAIGTRFTAPNGRTFEVTNLFTGRGSANNVVTSNDRLMIAFDDSTYGFIVDVVATEVGSDSNIEIFTTLTNESPTSNFIRAYASNTFTGGLDEESTTSLLPKLQAGIAHRSLSSRSSIEGVIRSDEDYANIVALSVVGYGDPEQIRYHGLFPIAFGGRVDAYVRSSENLNIVELTKTATLINANGTWQFTMFRDDVPGFYEISKILLPSQSTDSTGFSVSSDIRGVDTTEDPQSDSTPGTSFIPDIETAEEAAYSRYQTAVIKFLDDETSTAGLTPGVSTASYKVYVKAMPGIAEIQDLVSDRSVRSPAGDCLVKAAVPCFTSITIEIEKKSSDPDIDTDVIKQDIIRTVNSTGFTGKLSASKITAAVESSVRAQSITDFSIASISLVGRILRPDMTTRTVTSSTMLEIGDEASQMVTGRTTVFITSTDIITITVSSSDSPEI